MKYLEVLQTHALLHVTVTLNSPFQPTKNNENTLTLMFCFVLLWVKINLGYPSHDKSLVPCVTVPSLEAFFKCYRNRIFECDFYNVNL